MIATRMNTRTGKKQIPEPGGQSGQEVFMTVSEFVKFEMSGAIFRVVDATQPGCRIIREALTEADRNVVRRLYGDAQVVGFEPQGKKVILYICV